MTDLKHYSYYKIKVIACHSYKYAQHDVPMCSKEIAMVTERTKKRRKLNNHYSCYKKEYNTLFVR